MNTIKSLTGIKLFFVFLIALLGGCSNPETEEIKDTINIGAIASLTGPAGEEGQNWLNGAKLAAEHLKDKGINVNLIIEDDETNPAKTASAFTKLASVDKVRAIIGGTWDFLGEAAYPLALKYKVPFLTPTNPSDILSDAAKKNPFVYSNGLLIDAEKKAVRVFLQKKNPKTIALVYPAIPWGEFHARMIEEIATELGITVTLRYSFPVEGYLDSIRLASLKISGNPPDLVYTPIEYNGLVLFGNEFKRLKISPIILATQHLDSALTLASDKSTLKNLYGVYPASDSADFDSAFLKKFGTSPKVYSAAGYDALNFLAAALKDKIDLGNSSTVFSYAGITGVHRLPAPDRGLVENRAKIMTTQSGKLEDAE